MRQALRLAQRGLGSVAPNPPVGAVAVRDGEVVATGYHARFGGPHAEAALIASVADGALRGADLYVTLEPCAHQGKTPPCTDAIIRAGFRRVHYAVADPNPLTHGQGPARLAAAGIAVDSGLCADESRWLLAPFLRWIRERLPIVTLKWAMTADGRIASRTGDARWISSTTALAYTRRARRAFDAILIGSGTLLRDDPQLLSSGRGAQHPLRVLLDGRLRLTLQHRLVTTARTSPVLVATRATRGDVARERRSAELAAAGLEIAQLPSHVDSGIDLRALLGLLGERGITHVLVEGGSRVHGAFFDAGLADRVQMILAPKLIGGSAALAPIGGGGLERMADACDLRSTRLRRLGADLLLEGCLTPAGAGLAVW
ncbi:MAG: bifunctional diaminohydroxyphosphoribosylaminopyrimidine deaminase/5-amino-6-(5-phosphoribosylamino)uracil reductase RibD [Planctomycetota bacterium]